MSSFGTVISVLANNRADIEDAVSKVGGLDTVLRITPDVLRIVQTAMAGQPDPVAAVATAQATLEYSQATKARVEAFQKAHGLTVDGIVGDETWSKVESLLPK